MAGRRGARPLPAAILLAVALAGAAAGDEVPTPLPDLDEALELLEGIDPEVLDLPEGAGSDLWGALGLLALEADQPVRAREIAERALAEDPESVPGHCLLGAVQWRAEGNLPRAAFHLERCRALFERAYGEPDPEDPWYWHWFALDELARVDNVLGRQEQTLARLDELARVHGSEVRHRRGWPLVQLGRYAQARAESEAVIRESDDSAIRSRALGVLCFLESEVGDAEATYEVCRAALALDREHGLDAVVLTNAAEAARGVGRMDQAEEWLLEATRLLQPDSLAVPWMDLMNQLLDQARTAEAVDAMREMFAWRDRHPPYIDVQNWARQDLSAAELLLVAGLPVEAARLAARALEQPDRLGMNSIAPEQLEAGAAILEWAAHRAAAERLREEASWSPFWRAWRLRLEALGFRLRAWRAERRLVALLTDERLLLSLFAARPSGLMRLPEWLEPDLTAVLGPGVVAAALEQARAHRLVQAGRGYGPAFEAEVAALRGRRGEALERAEQALAELPRWEVLLRARAAPALAAGQERRAAELLDLVFQLDPGVVRRMGLALPARFDPPGSDVARETLALLRRSPRLREGEHGFRVSAQDEGAGASACLLGLNDVVLACGRVEPGAAEPAQQTARRLAAAFHETAFALRVDLTQSDLKSLDGSTVVAGGRGEDRLRLIVRDLTAGEGAD